MHPRAKNKGSANRVGNKEVSLSARSSLVLILFKPEVGKKGCYLGNMAEDGGVHCTVVTHL